MKPIRQEEEYQAALEEVERLWDSVPGSSDHDRAEVLTILIEDYEQKTYPVEAPDPVAYLQFLLDQGKLTRQELEKILDCGKGRVSEILSQRRSLSLSQMVRLWSELAVPAEGLMRYAVKKLGDQLVVSRHESSRRSSWPKPSPVGIRPASSDQKKVATQKKAPAKKSSGRQLSPRGRSKALEEKVAATKKSAGQKSRGPQLSPAGAGGKASPKKVAAQKKAASRKTAPPKKAPSPKRPSKKVLARRKAR